jgi:hypothetical protein
MIGRSWWPIDRRLQLQSTSQMPKDQRTPAECAVGDRLPGDTVSRELPFALVRVPGRRQQRSSLLSESRSPGAVPEPPRECCSFV